MFFSCPVLLFLAGFHAKTYAGIQYLFLILLDVQNQTIAQFQKNFVGKRESEYGMELSLCKDGNMPYYIDRSKKLQFIKRFGGIANGLEDCTDLCNAARKRCQRLRRSEQTPFRRAALTVCGSWFITVLEKESSIH